MRRDDHAARGRKGRLADRLRARLGDEFHPSYLQELASALAAPTRGLPDRFRKTMTAAEAEAALAAAAEFRNAESEVA